MIQPPGHHLAQLNIGRIRYEVDDPRMAGFVDNLAFVNALAERSEGFVWRYQDASGNATDTRPYDGDPMMAVNMSVWENVELLEKYVWQTVHKRFYAKRHEWFETMAERYLVMWWVPAGHRPTIQEAIERLEHLKAHGASEHAFGWENIASAQLWKNSTMRMRKTAMTQRRGKLTLRLLDDLREAMEEFRRALHDPLHRNGNRLDPNDPRWVTAFLVGMAIFLGGLVVAGALMVWLR